MMLGGKDKRWNALFQDLKVGDNFDFDFFLNLNKTSLPFQKAKDMELYFNSLTDKSVKSIIKKLNNTDVEYFPFLINKDYVDLTSLSKFISCDEKLLESMFDTQPNKHLSLTSFHSKMNILLKKYIKTQLK